MNGRTCETTADVESREDTRPRSAALRALRPFVLPVWEGWAGFDEKNSVCIEARLYFSSPEISCSAGILTFSFEEDSFPVTLKFGQG